MKNSEKYDDVYAMSSAFREFCSSRICDDCPVSYKTPKNKEAECAFLWLQLDDDDAERNCGYCNSKPDTVKRNGKYCVECGKCGTRGPGENTRESARRSWNLLMENIGRQGKR